VSALSRGEFIRLRGTVVAVSTLLTIVSLVMIFDQRAPGATTEAATPTSTPTEAVTVTAPLDNRICGLATRVITALPPNEPDSVRTLEGFYTDLATFTDGELHGDFLAASRFYKEVNDIGRKAEWDLDRIVRNNDGDRWRALMTGMPTGVQESRHVIRDRCRIEPPEPPSIATDARGRILDPLIAQKLAAPEREILRPPPPPPEETEPTG
jgi:hypothetical protein